MGRVTGYLSTMQHCYVLVSATGETRSNQFVSEQVETKKGAAKDGRARIWQRDIRNYQWGVCRPAMCHFEMFVAGMAGIEGCLLVARETWVFLVTLILATHFFLHKSNHYTYIKFY